MAASIASQVNERLYHARLLVEMREALDSSEVQYRARQKALSLAAVAALIKAYQLFIQELAESCKITAAVYNSQSLADALAEEQRSHAVVQTLLALEAEPQSWLSELLATHANPSAFSLSAQKTTNANMIALSQNADIDLSLVIKQFTDFVDGQRDFLQEW